jgi:hypothetical protein
MTDVYDVEFHVYFKTDSISIIYATIKAAKLSASKIADVCMKQCTLGQMDFVAYVKIETDL